MGETRACYSLPHLHQKNPSTMPPPPPPPPPKAFLECCLGRYIGNTDITLCFCQFIVHSVGGCIAHDRSLTKLGVTICFFYHIFCISEKVNTVFAITHGHVLVATLVFCLKIFQFMFHISTNSACQPN